MTKLKLTTRTLNQTLERDGAGPQVPYFVRIVVLYCYRAEVEITSNGHMVIDILVCDGLRTDRKE